MIPKRILKYEDMIPLIEELQQLKGVQLQRAVDLSDNRYGLLFYFNKEVRTLILDLTPAFPFFVCISGGIGEKPKRRTPISNFMNAHFCGKRLRTIELAEKPNRTVRLQMGEDDSVVELLFQCFPHGQEIKVSADGKNVYFPWRPDKKGVSSEPISFIEFERKSDWSTHEQWAALYLGETQVSVSGAPMSQKSAKLKKALDGMKKEESLIRQREDEKIQEWHLQAERVKVGGETIDSDDSKGAQLQKIYEDIRKTQRKREIRSQRVGEIKRQLDALESTPQLTTKVLSDSVKKSSFKGTRVLLNQGFELWVGRSALQNDELVREAKPHELWIHLRDYPGAHGIIRGPKNKHPLDTDVDKSCCVVALLSQRRKNPFQDGEKLDFIVTPRKFVRKPKGAKPGLVVVERETVRRVAFRVIKFDVL